TKSSTSQAVAATPATTSAVDSSCEQQQQLTKECSESSEAIATEAAASSDQSMDVDVDSKTKPNGAVNGGSKSYTQNGTGESVCKICSKHVYQMEQIKAEKSVFHMACFRCQECKKQLKVDSYSSHEGVMYCKPHFKQLFQPKPVIVNDSSEPKTPTPRKYELIIAENTPQELPADVVRSSTRQEDVFENINLDLSNIRNRFENGARDSNTDAIVSHSNGRKASGEKLITRSESIHKIMQKYQSRVAGDKDTTSSDEEDNHSAKSADEQHLQQQSEKQSSPKVSFSGMSALKTQWESGSINANNKSEKERVEEELAELRQKVKTSEPLKQAYERAVQEAKSVENLAAKSHSDNLILEHSSVKAGSLKEKFEKGKVDAEQEVVDRAERERKEREEEISRIAVSETCTKEARNKFKQIEANMGKDQVVPTNGGGGGGVHGEDTISSNELQQRIKNFENFKDNQSANAKEGSDEIDANVDDIPKADTTKKMLDKFKALEAGQSGNGGPSNGAPKSPIRITPPRETAAKSLYESEPAAERDPNIVRSSYKTEDDIQVEPEKAKNLRAKFENWQTEIEREGRKSENEEEYVPNIDTTKNLRAMFESIKDEYKPAEKPRPRVNRFVENKAPPGETCYVCSSRLYPMEKMEFSGIKIHKNCFRCNKCHAPLRLDNFTVTAEKLFCIPHFKQLFMEKGNYDEGFGLEQHKDKWSNKMATTAGGTTATTTNGQSATNGQSNGEEKLENGDGEETAADLLVETTGKAIANGNGVHHDDEEEEVEGEGELLQQQNGHHHNGGGGSVEDHLSTEGDDEQQYVHEEQPVEAEVQPKQQPLLQNDDDLDVLQQQVGHLELEHGEAILDGPIALPVDNQA
ncbi:LIM domain and actin-binding protein 1, partial [Tyrophagus putrescentiae]